MVDLSKLDVEALSSDAPARDVWAGVSSVSAEVLSSERAAQSVTALAAIHVEALVADAPIIDLFTESIEIVSASEQAKNLNALLLDTSIEVLYKTTAVSLFRTHIEALYQYRTVPTIGSMVTQGISSVLMHANWPSIADTISTTRLKMHGSLVVQKENVIFDQSISRIKNYTTLILQRSVDRLVIGPVHVPSTAALFLQSDLYEHIPVSMSYGYSVAAIVLQRTPMGFLPRSISRNGQSAMKVLQRTPMGFLPRSITRNGQSAMKVLQRTPMGFLPQSETNISSAVQTVLAKADISIPDQGTNEVGEVAQTIILKETDFEVQGDNQVLAAAALAVQQVVPVAAISTERVASVSSMALMRDVVLPPGEMTGVYGHSVFSTLLCESFYPSPDVMQGDQHVLSVSAVVLRAESVVMPASAAMVGGAGISWLQGADYPSPGSMLPPSRSALVPGLAQITVQQAESQWPISMSRSLSSAQLTLQHADYDSPEDIYNNGVFIWEVAEAAASNDSGFTDPTLPGSQVRADLMTASFARFDADFRDPTQLSQPAEATLAVESVSRGDDGFPDVTQPLSDVSVSSATEAFAQNDVFRDPTIPASLLIGDSVAEAAALEDSEFPDPASLRSPVSVYSVSESAAIADEYPDPALPGSTLELSVVTEVVAIRDASLIGVPDYAKKHRPIVTVNIVYSDGS